MTPDDQIAAAELALGLLDGPERAAALERLLADPAFAADVAGWRERFAHLLDQYEPAEPPSGLIDRIDPAAPGTPPRRRSRWPLLAGGAVAGALAASLATLAIVSPAPAPPIAPPAPAPAAARPLLAVLMPTGDRIAQTPTAVLVDRDSRVVRLSATIVIPADRVAELWRIGSDKTPRPIGLLSHGSRTPVLIDLATLPAADDTLAISIEPQGGSPSGKPTGPVVATGSLVLS